ncbi:MAG TPA: glycosyltransferase family 2 protein [Thermoanaerobaculia bacterium]|nr:glycosyltransferase family 2 protein [Thermoanaerobaculia bacterium]
MTVSVLLPAYNAARYVPEAIASVMAQTYKDWELVAIDDASSDDTAHILEAWAAREPRIRVFRNEANRGMTGNWNRCLAEARHELVIKLDADDVLRPRALAVLTEAMHGDAIAAGVRTLMCDEQLEPFGALPADEAMLRAGIDPYRDHDLPAARWWDVAAHGHQLWHSCALLFRRSLVGGGWDERFGCASDTEVISRVLEQDGVVAHRAYVGVWYRTVPDSVSGVFRRNDWLVWEGVAGNLLTLARVRKHRELPRGLRIRYAYLWERWQKRSDALPPAIAAKLEDVVGGLEPPPAADRALWRVRKVIAG